MKIGAAIGSLSKVLEEELKAGERAVTAGMREASNQLKNDLRDDVRKAGLGGRLANTWRSQVYPKGGASLGAAGLVWSKAPQIARAYTQGATIRHRGGGWLAIPTGYNKGGGWRKSKAAPLVSVAQMVAAKGQTFVLPGANGSLVWFMRVTRAQSIGRKPGRDLAYVGGDRLVGSGRVKRTREILARGAVPMFILVREVRVAKRLNIDGIGAAVLDRLPDIIVKHWEQQR